MSKFKKLFIEMTTLNSAKFLKFKNLNNQFKSDPITFRKEFNFVGNEIMEIIKVYENKLCNNSEMYGLNKYSSKLTEKFWELLREMYSEIDEVGVEVE